MSILIDEKTPILVQGITGDKGSFHAREMIDYGYYSNAPDLTELYKKLEKSPPRMKFISNVEGPTTPHQQKRKRITKICRLLATRIECLFK